MALKLLIILSVLLPAVSGLQSCGMQGDLYLPEENTEKSSTEQTKLQKQNTSYRF